MKLISWNMHQRAENWAVLAELMREYDAVAAMVQEAVAPPLKTRDDLRVFPDPSLGDKPWRMPVPTGARRNCKKGLSPTTVHHVHTCLHKACSFTSR